MTGKNTESQENSGSDTPVSEGALDRFIREFHAFEVEADLFADCVDAEGFAWWDLVRYNVQYPLCIEQGIYARQAGLRSSPIAKLMDRAMQALALTRDMIWFAFGARRVFDQVFVYRRRAGRLPDIVRESARPCLVVCDGDAFAAPHAVIRRQSVELLVRAVAKLVRVPEDVSAVAARIDAKVRTRFQTELNIHGIIVNKYRLHRASRIIWSRILGRLQDVKLVAFINDDTLKTLVWMANDRNIPTREYQHGYMGKSHLNYSYPPLAVAVPTLPTEVSVDRDTGDITYPVRVVRLQPKSDSQASDDADTPRDIDVLVGSSPTRAADTVSILQSLMGHGLNVAVKLHPNQTTESSGLRNHFTENQVGIIAGEIDFCMTARRSRIFVPANQTSTTVFEAVENGARLVVVDYDGVKLAGMIDGIVSARVTSFQALPDAVLAALGTTVGPTEVSG